MFSRLGQFSQRWLRRIIFTAPITVPITIWGLQKKQEARRYQDAYQVLETHIKKRSSHKMMNSVFNNPQTTSLFGNDETLKNKRTSIESIAEINASNSGSPILWNKDGSQSELNTLSLDEWPNFLENLSGKIFITFGFRKAMAASIPVQFTHAVIYVHDALGNHAFFGYFKRGSEKATTVGIKESVMINDARNTTILPLYTLHDELTIAGDKAQARQLFETIEMHARQRFTGWTMNCYTPIIASLIQAKAMGFEVPEFYRESLLIVVPSERNYGAGISNNKLLAPIAAELIDDIQIPAKKTIRQKLI